MLIGKRKKRISEEEQFRNEIREQLRELTRGAAAEQNDLSSLKEDHSSLQEDFSSLREELKRLRGDLSRQNMSLEDCLETLSALEEDRENTRRQKRAAEQETEKLLGLISLFQQQMWDMKLFASGRDDAWLEQLSLSEKTAREKMLSCGMVPIGEIGETIDYNLHEIIKTMETNEKDQDRKVASVYRPGCLYKGTVYQKAQVAAYRLITNTETGE